MGLKSHHIHHLIMGPLAQWNGKRCVIHIIKCRFLHSYRTISLCHEPGIEVKVNVMSPIQKDRHFEDAIFKCIFWLTARVFWLGSHWKIPMVQNANIDLNKGLLPKRQQCTISDPIVTWVIYATIRRCDSITYLQSNIFDRSRWYCLIKILKPEKKKKYDLKITNSIVFFFNEDHCIFIQMSWTFLFSMFTVRISPQIATFMGPSWGPPGSCWPQMGSMLAPWTLLSGSFFVGIEERQVRNRHPNQLCENQCEKKLIAVCNEAVQWICIARNVCDRELVS